VSVGIQSVSQDFQELTLPRFRPMSEVVFKEESRFGSSLLLAGVFGSADRSKLVFEGELGAADLRSPFLPRKVKPKMDFLPLFSFSGESGGNKGLPCFGTSNDSNDPAEGESRECFEEAEDFLEKKGMPDGVRCAVWLLGDSGTLCRRGEDCAAMVELTLGTGDLTEGEEPLDKLLAEGEWAKLGRGDLSASKLLLEGLR
jgi:hypothetical protein